MKASKKLILLLVLTPVLFSCSSNALMKNEAGNENAVPFELSITSPQDGQVLEVLDDVAAQFVSQYTSTDSYGSVLNYYNAGLDQHHQRPLEFTWSAPEGYQYFLFKFSEKKDMSNPLTFMVNEPKVSITKDFYIDTTYYYQVDAFYSDHLLRSKVFSFVTNNSIRSINAPGVSNIRDLGGPITIDGRHRVKQGILYRSAVLDGVNSVGIDYLVNTIGIKTDVDLRAYGEGKDTSPLGINLVKYDIGCPQYADKTYSINGTEQYRENLLKYLRAFTVEENYPIIYHCAAGRDRTGTVSLLLDSLLGVDIVKAHLRYEFTFMSHAGSFDMNNDALQNLLNEFANLNRYLSNYGSGTIQENVEAFMLDLGLTQTEINNIRNIMLEEI